MRGFASDNISGAHPEVLKALNNANADHTLPYGDDQFTQNAKERFKGVFGSDISVYFTFNGTAANVLSLAAITTSYNAVVCSETAHINVDECGAPEKFIGCKLFPLKSNGGKIDVKDVEPLLSHLGFEHHNQPSVISITQPTELGEIYTIEEVEQITLFAKKHDMLVHMDGARIANAAAFFNTGLREITRDLGIDVLSFGGTKNGAMFGEAVVFFNPELSKDFKYIRKQCMQLGSKMRYIAVQLDALLTNELWKKNAAHANTMAQKLYHGIKDLDCVTIEGKVQTNAIFARIPKDIVNKLQKDFFFYTWDEQTSLVRFMTGFDTTDADIDDFIAAIKKVCG